MAKPKIYFIDQKFRTIDIWRIIYFFVFIFSFCLTEAGRNIYRPYIYSNDINDFGLADSIGNLGGIVVQIFFMLSFFNPVRKKAWLFIIFLPFGYIAYEIAQPYLPRGVFDMKDVWGSFVGGLIAAMIFIFIRGFIKNRTIIKF